jgi:hypothetical protein
MKARPSNARPGTVQLADLGPDEILNLNKAQTTGRVHPFTCPDRSDGNHRSFNGDFGALVATRRGWICPWCDYRQDWAHVFMATAAASRPMPQISRRKTVRMPFDASDVRALLDGHKKQLRLLADPCGLPTLMPGDKIVVQEAFLTSWGQRFTGGMKVVDAAGEQRGGTFAAASESDPLYVYFESAPPEHWNERWRPADEMPDWASRFTLVVDSSRRCALHDMTEHDADAEGVETDIWDQALAARDYSKVDGWFCMGGDADSYADPGVYREDPCLASFATLWDKRHGEGSWAANPRVENVKFKVERRDGGE